MIIPPPGHKYSKEFKKINKINDLIFAGTLLIAISGFIITVIAVLL